MSWRHLCGAGGVAARVNGVFQIEMRDHCGNIVSIVIYVEAITAAMAPKIMGHVTAQEPHLQVPIADTEATSGAFRPLNACRQSAVPACAQTTLGHGDGTVPNPRGARHHGGQESNADNFHSHALTEAPKF